MKASKTLAIVAISALLLSCGGKKAEHKCIAPMPAGISIENLQDCCVPAQFTSENFNWMGGLLGMKVSNMDLYDAVEVTQLQVGDTIMYAGEPIVINKIEETASGMEINGGQVDEGGCRLVGYEGGTYIARGMDDHATFTELGYKEVPLAEDFVVIDCGVNPDDPSDTIRTDQKLYLENLKDGRDWFSPLNTVVTIQNGNIVEIKRRWIP